jgi:hypothetical protein
MLMNLHLPSYRETIGYFENKYLPKKFLTTSRNKSFPFWSITVTVVKVFNTACKISTFTFVECQTLWLINVFPIIYVDYFYFFFKLNYTESYFQYYYVVDKLQILVILLSWSWKLHAIDHHSILSQPMHYT